MASFTVVRAEDLEAEKDDESKTTLRCLTSDLGCLTRQDGAASLSQGDTTAMAVVYGPVEVRINKELIDRATVEVVYKPKVGLPRPADKKREHVIRNTLESAIMTRLHPRSSVSVVVQETEDLGSYLACCINASCLALLDAAVSMKFMVAAIAAAVSQTGDVYVDPTKKIEDEARATLTFVFDSEELNVVTVLTSGRYSREEYKRCLDLCRSAAGKVFAFYKESMSKKLLRSA